MIHIDSHSKEWLEEVKKKFPKKDPLLIEKVIKAISLLEELVLLDLDFIFKGGTSLILLLKKPQRFSIDIDIIIEKIPDNLETLFSKIIERGVFSSFEEDVRKTKIPIPKRHYKFYFNSVASPTSKYPSYVLLDILEQKSTYPRHENLKIDTPFIKLMSDPKSVRTPSVDSILGDKLTAFAPKTTGIKYNSGKDLEIIKQLFDIALLFEEFLRIEEVFESFKSTAEKEIEYRELNGLAMDAVLIDSIEAAEAIAFRGKVWTEEFESLKKGINSFASYTLEKKFTIETATACSGKIAYLAKSLLLQNKEIKRFTSPQEIGSYQITNEKYLDLNKLKKTNPEAFFYWYHTSILEESVL